jgi:hypothetical protein
VTLTQKFLWSVALLFVSVYGGNFFVRYGLRFTHRGIDTGSKPHALAGAIGMIERFIYTSVVLFGLPFVIIGGWLALKGFAKFRPKGTGEHATEKYLNEYYSYLIGTGLSLIFGVGFGILGRLLVWHLDLPK